MLTLKIGLREASRLILHKMMVKGNSFLCHSFGLGPFRKASRELAGVSKEVVDLKRNLRVSFYYVSIV